MILAGTVERDAMGRAARRLHLSFAVADPIVEQLMSKRNDLSRSLVPLNPDTTLIAVIEMSQSSCLLHPKGRSGSTSEENGCIFEW
jgi:hypothetical protein